MSKLTSRIKTADEIVGTTYYDQQMDRIEGLEAIRATWYTKWNKVPRDTGYVSDLENRIDDLKKRV